MPENPTPAELESAIKAVASVAHKKKGTVLFRRGDPGMGIFFILRGQVSLTLDGRDSVYPERKLGSGAILGLPATLSGGAYSLGAEVSADAELAFVPRQAFLEMLAKDTNLCLEALNMLGNEIGSIRSALVSHRTKKPNSARM